MASALASPTNLTLSLRSAISLRSSSPIFKLTRQPFLQRTRLALGILGAVAVPAISIRLPGFLSDIWESVLRAVPKKKTSHRKKRQRFLAGKALQDLINLNKCPGCGAVKRAHTLCPYCVQEIKDFWAGRDITGKDKPADTTALEKQ